MQHAPVARSSRLFSFRKTRGGLTSLVTPARPQLHPLQPAGKDRTGNTRTGDAGAARLWRRPPCGECAPRTDEQWAAQAWACHWGRGLCRRGLRARAREPRASRWLAHHWARRGGPRERDQSEDELDSRFRAAADRGDHLRCRRPDRLQ